MNADVKEQAKARNPVARALRGVFKETVFHFALLVGVVVALVDGVTSLNPGTFV